MGFAFCPRIRDFNDKKLFIKGKAGQYPALQSLISPTRINLKEKKFTGVKCYVWRPQ
ncbi:Tn3 family transposase [Escherichia coli]|uniref:Tn3 family transposase n=1 Tax=Escherichia coli TaxID=562 RepID=UPI000B25B606